VKRPGFEHVLRALHLKTQAHVATFANASLGTLRAAL
jgi:hypothetical protein